MSVRRRAAEAQKHHVPYGRHGSLHHARDGYTGVAESAIRKTKEAVPDRHSVLDSTSRILSQIDLKEVHKQIRTIRLLEYEYDQIAAMLIRACDKWLLTDLEWDEAIIETKEVHDGFSFIYDLVLVSGKLAVAKDWKTGSIDRRNYDVETKWSDQSSIYLRPASSYLESKHGVELESLEYRCVGYGPEAKTKSIMVYPREIHTHDAYYQKDSVQQIYWSLIDFPVWPRNKPSACRGYDYECPWWDDCTKMTMPRGQTWDQMKGVAPRSKSAFKSFLACPERYRREDVLGNEAPRRPSTAIMVGEAFHLGAASIWGQLFEIKKKGELNL